MATKTIPAPMPTNKRFKDLTGLVYGKYKVLGYAGYRPYPYWSTKLGRNVKRGQPIWFCLCTSCSTEHEVLGQHLRNGRATQCQQCQVANVLVPKAGPLAHATCTTHGHTTKAKAKADGMFVRKNGGTGSATYTSWQNMLARCTNPNCNYYHRYGGRGITVDPKWHTFEGFLADMHEKPGRGWAIDRLDSDGPYTKSNCEWVTPSENSRRMNAERRRKGLPSCGALAALTKARHKTRHSPEYT
jgi:hypothetical protein